MYKVMLLDDEPWELKGLKYMLPWNEYHFEVISVLNNPLEALEILKKQSFDVLVTDIRMPGLDGIHLMKKIREFDSNLEIIFISGYAEFEYAREALRNGAYDYLLKPVDLDATRTLLLHLKNKIDEKEHAKSLRLMEQITEENLNFQDLFPEITDEFSCYSVITNVDIIPHLQLKEKNNLQNASVFFCSIPYGNTCHLYLFACKNSFDLCSFLQTNFSGQMIGISLPLNGFERLSNDAPNRLIAQAFCAYHNSFFLYPNQLYVYTKTDKNALRTMIDQFQTFYRNKKREDLYNFVNNLPQTLCSISINVNGMVHLWNQWMMFIMDSELYEESCLLSTEYMLEHYSDIRQLSKKLLFLLENEVSSESERSTEEGKELYHAMIQYVNEHFREPITLQDVADCAHINFTYASKLFKKYTNTNYSKYLTELRISLACQLLQDTNKSTEEICYETGFRDYFYFNKTFKKLTGQTPLQYRRK